MYRGKRIAAIITAGGIGSRMGEKMPKQYLKINGVPIIKKTVKTFEENEYVDSIVVTAPKGYETVCGDILVGMNKVISVVTGGEQRQDSVANALRELSKLDCYDYVLIHDGARPYITDIVIEDTLDKTLECGAAVAAVPVKDTIRNGILTLERKSLYQIQTPQGFRRDIINEAHIKAASDGYYGTDDGGLVERMGLPVAIAKGDYKNIKITTREDLPAMLRIGKGYDVHKLVFDRDLILAGVKIPYEKGLLGHSDADVLIHAIMDALLGAAALGDIGKHFPDSQEEYKGISSILLLKKVGELLENSGYEVVNIDSTIIAERPKVSSYIENMRKNIAEALNLDIETVSVKATTTEGLGFTGRKEGIAADAIAMIKENY